ncbi:MAG: Indolepyruvate oxidoreductase subunit IorB [Candidatus Methanofastidiosum methylothiophilum]|uniref:Indolepyruvate ferredoxin oxidoreductase subunit beta n=1 Tax=Candidatus Methanofastidiosum methylothiophilum TaxID=1705564 RepID=A0A150J0X5_9EURY|nr:MAG: Indolepyruvate oxidoreductase subunit IorB [Candidatus Methanofastidiosum methylthiophilus]KYC48220.1 MAG: Indolepyruvate oxidoreductase subunit IorB [Candidatus Methanofastidiosum methylthiophilus]KYC50877.1 MAG: Indolepyruvate oxidoreductase subunit IorB [Candidatus Methanofastidiosum methylthiophilus]
MEFNILICGVGGQGTILASYVLGNAALKEGHKVRLGEIHGMAQRGGSVVSHVRMGDEVYGPVIPQGKADILIAFEPLEALRNISYLRKGGKTILNTEKINPISVSLGECEYPPIDEILFILSEKGKVYHFNATEIAKGLGNQVVMNMVLIGALSLLEIPIKNETLLETIKDTLSKKADINLKAFEAGRKKIESLL